MRFDLDMGNASDNKINAYELGQIKINDEIYYQNLLITPKEIIIQEPACKVQELTAGHAEKILALKPDVVILGTGSELIQPNPEFMNPLWKHKIGVEVMNSRSACHTYNLLMAEGRAVAAIIWMK